MNTRGQTRLTVLGLVAAVTAGGIGCQKPVPRDNAARLARIELLYDRYREDFPGLPSVDPRDLDGLRARGRVVLVDVREEAERVVSAIPGAISAGEFEREAHSYEGAVVVAYCTIGHRSGLYAEGLRRRGLDARNLKGSILLWLHRGGRVVDRRGNEVKRVHVYGKEWDLAPEDYVGVW